MLQVLERREVIKVAKKFAEELVQTGLIPVKEIYLYGSYAVGNPNLWSDIDVAVIIDTDLEFEELIDVEAKVRMLARKVDQRIEPVIFTSDPLGFVESEVKKGIRIYPEVTNDKV